MDYQNMLQIGVVITALLIAKSDGQQTSRETSDVSSVYLILRDNLTDSGEWKTAVYCNNGTFVESMSLQVVKRNNKNYAAVNRIRLTCKLVLHGPLGFSKLFCFATRQNIHTKSKMFTNQPDPERAPR